VEENASHKNIQITRRDYYGSVQKVIGGKRSQIISSGANGVLSAQDIKNSHSKRCRCSPEIEEVSVYHKSIEAFILSYGGNVGKGITGKQHQIISNGDHGVLSALG
jgi:hypothetical protein